MDSLIIRVVTVKDLLPDPQCPTYTKREASIRSLRICVSIETKALSVWTLELQYGAKRLSISFHSVQ